MRTEEREDIVLKGREGGEIEGKERKIMGRILKSYRQKHRERECVKVSVMQDIKFKEGKDRK